MLDNVQYDGKEKLNSYSGEGVLHFSTKALQYIEEKQGKRCKRIKN